eukprot:g48.t1
MEKEAETTASTASTTSASPKAQVADESTAKPKKKKKTSSDAVKLHFKAVGGARIMKRRKFKMKPDKEWSVVSTFLRKQLKLKDTDPLFTYINSAFCPSPDQLVGNLFENFRINDELIVNYSITNAWG